MASPSVTCQDCGSANVDETHSPCPECGSTRRHRSLRLEIGAYSITSDNVQLVVTEYYKTLNDFSKSLIDQGQYGISIIVAHMACEIIVEQVFTTGFETKKVPELQEPVTDLFSGYNLSNHRIREVYTALTGDKIQDNKNTFWKKFKESAARRNRIMHKRQIASRQEAEETLEATGDLIAYLDQKFGTS
jgi:hypothetical protein